jgi:beta-mannanase
LNKNNLYRQLEQLWLQGYVSFIKIGSSTTIREIADGHYDGRLNQMAQLYKRWLANGGGRKAMFAPFQEMNGEWVPYYRPNTDPAQKQKDYKDAYRRVYDVFMANGIKRSQIWWVFSPNGWSLPEDNFELYYPGDHLVDIVGFASYNFGFCDATLKADGSDYGNWENYDRIYEPYIRRIEAMTPSKPIIVAETGTSGLTSKEARELKLYDYAMKSAWFELNYQYLAKQPKVIGIFYFDFDDLGNNVGCDLGIPRSNFNGYKDALRKSGFEYANSQSLDQAIP